MNTNYENFVFDAPEKFNFSGILSTIVNLSKRIKSMN